MNRINTAIFLLALSVANVGAAESVHDAPPAAARPRAVATSSGTSSRSARNPAGETQNEGDAFGAIVRITNHLKAVGDLAKAIEGDSPDQATGLRHLANSILRELDALKKISLDAELHLKACLKDSKETVSTLGECRAHLAAAQEDLTNALAAWGRDDIRPEPTLAPPVVGPSKGETWR